MKKIVIIGANDFQRPLIRKAKDMGYQTHVFAHGEKALQVRQMQITFMRSVLLKKKKYWRSVNRSSRME